MKERKIVLHMPLLLLPRHPNWRKDSMGLDCCVSGCLFENQTQALDVRLRGLIPKFSMNIQRERETERISALKLVKTERVMYERSEWVT